MTLLPQRISSFVGAVVAATTMQSAFAADPGHASVRASEASAMSVASTVAVVTFGSLHTFVQTGRAVVASVESVGGGTILVLRGVSNAGTASVRLSGQAAAGASIAVGTVVEVVASTTGVALIAAGRVIAFVPDAAARGLLHSTRVGSTR